MALFTQDIVVNDFNYTCFIINKDPSNYELIISGNGVQYSCIFTKNNDEFETLTSSIRKQEGLNCEYIFDENDTILKINIVHKLIKLNICYILKIVEKDYSFNGIIDERVKKLEDVQDKIYPLSDKSLGPCVILKDESYMKPDYMNSMLKKISKYDDLSYYYDIHHIYQNEEPICSKNQFFFNGINNFNDFKRDIENTYTVLIKKYTNDIVGIIKKYKTYIYISINTEINYNNISQNKISCVDKNLNNFKFALQDYFNNGYILEFPFYIKNGIYIGCINTGNNKKPFIIKNNKLYDASYLKLGGFVIEQTHIDNIEKIYIYNI